MSLKIKYFLVISLMAGLLFGGVMSILGYFQKDESLLQNGLFNLVFMGLALGVVLTINKTYDLKRLGIQNMDKRSIEEFLIQTVKMNKSIEEIKRALLNNVNLKGGQFNDENNNYNYVVREKQGEVLESIQINLEPLRAYETNCIIKLNTKVDLNLLLNDKILDKTKIILNTI